MNETHGGFKDDDYIVFYGRPKSKKSWVLTALIAHLFEADKRILVYTKEMSPQNVFDRVIACMAKISYEKLRAGKLNPVDEENFNFMIDMVHDSGMGQNIICLSGQDAPTGGDTVQWLTSKVDRYNPDFICVDGLYLMSDVEKAKKDNERVRNISRALRQMVLSRRKPLIATLQANRGAAKHEEANLDELAFSDAIGQDATCIMRVINEKEKNTCQLVMGGAREYQLNGFRINADPAYDFSYYGPLSAKEIIEAEKADGEPDDNSAAHVKKKNGASDKPTANKNVMGRIKT
jgi:replicative DNA helicase